MVWTTSYDSIIRFFLIIISIYSIEILAGFFLPLLVFEKVAL